MRAARASPCDKMFRARCQPPRRRPRVRNATTTGAPTCAHGHTQKQRERVHIRANEPIPPIDACRRKNELGKKTKRARRRSGAKGAGTYLLGFVPRRAGHIGAATKGVSDGVPAAAPKKATDGSLAFYSLPFSVRCVGKKPCMHTFFVVRGEVASNAARALLGS